MVHRTNDEICHFYRTAQLLGHCGGGKSSVLKFVPFDQRAIELYGGDKGSTSYCGEKKTALRTYARILFPSDAVLLPTFRG